jgi:2-iminobutanoate/2-iminopropanoate deaminase
MYRLQFVIVTCLSLVLIACESTEKPLTKEIISTEHAPPAIGPYTQAIRVGDFLFLSGQIPINPVTGEVEDGDIALQTERVLKNIGAVLLAGGMGYEDIVHCSVFLADLDDFESMNRVYASYFTTEPPTRATVEVSRLPRDVKIEISAIAMKTKR